MTEAQAARQRVSGGRAGPRPDGPPGAVATGSPAFTLFLAMLAAQSTTFVLTPIVPLLAADFGVPVAAVGSLRAISGLVAVLATPAIGVLSRRLSLPRLLTLGLGLVGLGSLVAGLAVDFTMLAASQVAVGAGMGVTLTASLTACAEWAPPGGRARLLSWAMMGPPLAAILAPLASGALAPVSWRAAWLAVPFVLSAAAAVAVRSRSRGGAVAPPGGGLLQALRRPVIASWALGELFAYSGWSVVIVYSGALLVQSYGVGEIAAAAAIGACAVAFMVGNRAVRGRTAHARVVLLVLALALAIAGLAFGAVRSEFWISALLLVVLGLVAGGRTLAASAFGLDAAHGRDVDVMAVRTMAQQLGYVVGGAVGGLVLAGFGYGGLGLLMAALFVSAALPHLAALRSAVEGCHFLRV